MRPSGMGSHRLKRTRRRTSLPFQDKRVISGAVIIVALAVIGVSLARWSGSPSAHDDPGKPCAPLYLGKQDSDVCADASGTVSMDYLTVSATPLAATDDETGGISLCSNITLTNNSPEKQDYNSQDFTIQDPGGDKAPPDSGVANGALRSGALGPGGTKTGKVCDDRATRKGMYAVIYAPSLFGAQRGVWLSQH